MRLVKHIDNQLAATLVGGLVVTIAIATVPFVDDGFYRSLVGTAVALLGGGAAGWSWVRTKGPGGVQIEASKETDHAST